MVFVHNPDETNLENIQRHVGFIIQTIENHDPPMERVLRELRDLANEVRTEVVHRRNHP